MNQQTNTTAPQVVITTTTTTSTAPHHVEATQQQNAPTWEDYIQQARQRGDRSEATFFQLMRAGAEAPTPEEARKFEGYLRIIFAECETHDAGNTADLLMRTPEAACFFEAENDLRQMVESSQAEGWRKKRATEALNKAKTICILITRQTHYADTLLDMEPLQYAMEFLRTFCP